MLIDWFTVAAQILNFLVIVYLLKRFLYGRIIRAMDEREQRIASRLSDADLKILEAEKQAELYREKNAQFEVQREELLSRAREEVELKRVQLMDEAREEVKTFRARWLESVREERESFLRTLRESMCTEVYRVCRRALAVLANADLERSMIGVFTEKVRGLDPNEWRGANLSNEDSQTGIIISSSFEIPQNLRHKISDAVQEQFASERMLEFEISPDLICGIELRAHDQKLAWSIAEYMESLEERVAQVIDLEAQGAAPNGRGKSTEGAGASE